jgi:hypothetical protein
MFTTAGQRAVVLLAEETEVTVGADPMHAR